MMRKIDPGPTCDFGKAVSRPEESHRPLFGGDSGRLAQGCHPFFLQPEGNMPKFKKGYEAALEAAEELEVVIKGPLRHPPDKECPWQHRCRIFEGILV
jgi:hypothetical protein